MNIRSGQFFLDPQWPFYSDENNPRFANFDFEYEDDACLCKVQEQENLVAVKVEHQSKELVLSDIEKQNSESSIANQSASEFMIEESQSSAVVIKQQESENDYNQDFVHQFSQLQSHIPVTRPRIRKRTNKKQVQPQLKNKVKKQREYERGKYNILSEELKKKIVDESKVTTMVEVAKKYNVSVNNICRWRKRCDRRSGAGRKVTDMDMECKLLEWLLKQNNPIPRKEVQLMAKRMSAQQDFKASKGWFERFYKRNKLSFYSNVEILTHNDYRQRIGKLALDKSKQQRLQLKQEEDSED